jgi:hypothetical protein
VPTGLISVGDDHRGGAVGFWAEYAHVLDEEVAEAPESVNESRKNSRSTVAKAS